MILAQKFKGNALAKNRCPSCGGHLMMGNDQSDKLKGTCQACHAEIVVSGATKQPAALPKATRGITIRDRSDERQSKPVKPKAVLGIDANLQIVRQAMNEKKLLSFNYTDSNGNVTSRTVEPYKLSKRNGSIILFGYCIEKEGIRSFNFNAMVGLNLQSYVFEPRWEIEDKLES